MLQQPDGFADFVAARSPSLLRTAWLLTGDWPSAEDLVQNMLVAGPVTGDRGDTPKVTKCSDVPPLPTDHGTDTALDRERRLITLSFSVTGRNRVVRNEACTVSLDDPTCAARKDIAAKIASAAEAY